MHYIKRLLVLAALLVGFGAVAFALPSSVSAASPYNPLHDACQQQDGKDSTACTSQDTAKFTGNDAILIRITRIVAVAAGVVAVVVIIIYGLQLIFSYGDASKATTARNAILAATGGLVVIGLAQAIVVYLIRNL